MTKGEWNKINIGTRVITKSWKLDRSGEKTVAVDIILHGSIVRINSNCSQALVKWDETDNEIWDGRLGLELEK